MPSSWVQPCRFPACFRSRPSVTLGPWRNASEQLATTLSATRSKDKLPKQCSRSVGPTLLGRFSGGRFIPASALRQRGGAAASGLGFHLERESARVVARGRAFHASIGDGRSQGSGRRDSILALAGG